MKYIIRPKSFYWIVAVLVLLVMTASCSFILGRVQDDIFRLALIILLLGIIAFILNRVLSPCWRNRLSIDRFEIAGFIDDLDFSIPWRNVTTIWLPENSPIKKQLFLGTDQGITAISINFFDEKQIMMAVRACARPEALQTNPYEAIPALRDWIGENRQILSSVKYPLRARQSGVRFLGWLGVSLGLAATLGSLYASLALISPVYVLLLGLGIYLLLSTSGIEMDDKGMTHYAWLGRYYMTWDEITRVVIDQMGSTLVLYGEGKRMSMPGPNTWSGKDKETMRTMLALQIIERKIEEKVSSNVFLIVPNRNTRVRQKTKEEY